MAVLQCIPGEKKRNSVFPKIGLFKMFLNNAWGRTYSHLLKDETESGTKQFTEDHMLTEHANIQRQGWPYL